MSVTVGQGERLEAVLERLLADFEIVDLSSDIGEFAAGPWITKVDVLEADVGASYFVSSVLPTIAPTLQQDFSAQDFPDRKFLRHELVTASTHAGSHIDAPGHYGGEVPPKHGGFISSPPPSVFVGIGICVDVSGSHKGVVGLSEFADALGDDAADLNRKIVLIHTSAQRGLSSRIVEYCVEQGCVVIGTDNDSFDGNFRDMLEAYVRTRDRDVLWPCHVIGRRLPYYQIERLKNLDLLPRTGFLVCAPPILIERATAAWTRALAFVPRHL